MPGVFISYRNIARSWAPMYIDWVLGQRFGRDHMFEAGRSILAGTNIPTSILRWIEQCSVLVVLIDPPWLSDLDKLRDDGDWVRREIVHARAHGKTLLPVLLDGAEMPSGRDLPPDVAPLTKEIAVRMRTRTASADVQRLIGEIERLAPDLVLASLTDPVRPAPATPAAYARAEHEVFPFRERPELDELVGWCLAPDGPLVRLVIGPPAAGKTRLGLELCARVRVDDRPAVLLSSSALPAALSRLGEISMPCLVVVDDAETRPAVVAAGLQALAAAPGTSSRLLLLSRAGTAWLEQFRDHPDDRVAALLDQVRIIRLEPQVPTDEDVVTARKKLAARLGLPTPPATAQDPLPATLLEAQVAALGELLAGGSPASLWQRLAEVERHHWQQTATAFGVPGLRREDLIEIMAMVTLFGAATEPEAETLFAALRALEGMLGSDRRATHDVVRAMLPGPNALNPIRPEPLADHLVTDLLSRPYPLADLASRVSDDQRHHALLALGRSLAANPDLDGPVSAMLAGAPALLLRHAMTAVSAIPRPERMVAPMTDALARLPDAELERLVTALPQRSEVLAHFAVDITERALNARLRNGTADVPAARLARDLATRLAYLGQRATDAVESAEVALRILTAHAGPGTGADLAEAYAALALAYDLTTDRTANAVTAGAEAITMFRALPADDRVRAALTTALTNQVERLYRGGQGAEARDLAAEAHTLASRLYEARPARFASLHADATDNLAALSEDEQLARTALELRRALARARPDAYRPQLAAALFNLGLIQHRSGDATEAHALWNESRALYESLAAERPGRFDDLLARVHRHLESSG